MPFKTRGKILRWVGRLFVASVALIAAAFIAVIEVAKREDSTARQFVEEREIGAAYAKIASQTADIWLENSFHARAYLDEHSGMLFTNLHVMRSLCSEPNFYKSLQPPCSQVEVNVSHNYPVMSFHKGHFVIVACSTWMDACALRLETKTPFKQVSQPQEETISSPPTSLVSLPIPPDTISHIGTFFRGHVVEAGHTFILRSRPSSVRYRT